MRSFLLVATILTVATGCDKAKSFPREAEKEFEAFVEKVAGRDPASMRPPRPYVDLASKPTVLFQVFGERGDPRMLPLGVVENGALKPLVLSRRGWRQFEQLYTAEGATLPFYQDGQRVGAARVRESMWQQGDSAALYSLPGCRLALPLTRVALEGDVAGRASVEGLASNGTFGRARAVSSLPAGEVRRTAGDIGLLVAARLGMSPRQLDSLDFRAIPVPTGTTARPTLVISYTDPTAVTADTSRGFSFRQVFIVADVGEFGYGPTYWYNQRVGFPNPEFRRYVDHLDLNGDGVDEIIIEVSRPLEGTAYGVLQYESDRWLERFRTDPNRCLDGKT
jgi:hypothetical protein